MNIVQSLDLLKSYDHLGLQRFEDGTLQIGKASHIAPMAWIHTMYPPLTEKELLYIEQETKLTIPAGYRDFLQISNGLTVFTRVLGLYGVRTDYNRDPYAVPKPFDIVWPNTWERPANAKATIFVIGSYSWDGSKLYMDSSGSEVYFCKENNSKPLHVWSSFEEMLEQEIVRLMSLFDEQGRPFDPDTYTLPVGKQGRWWTSLFSKK